MLETLKNILLKVENGSGSDFSGIGIVVYSDMNGIPVFPLHSSYYDRNEGKELESILIEISKLGSPYHDGFHFISSDAKLTHISQYFSPPIMQRINVDKSKIVGGRYMAALFGSCLQNVLLTGIVTNSNGIIIFENGKEIFFKEIM